MSELALKLIEENKKTRATFLDLGNCGLAEIPMEIGELFWLEELSFSNLNEVKGLERKIQNNGPRNEIRYFRVKGKNNPFLKLTNLRRLWLNCNISETSYSPESLSALSNLKKLEWLDFSNTRVSDLSGLARLTNLKWLDISNTKVSNLYPLAKLEKLENLYISSTKVSNLTALKELPCLKVLYAIQTRTTDLSPLAGMTKLEKLSVGMTSIEDLTPIGELVELKELNAYKTKVKDLIPLSKLTNLESLTISSNKAIIDLKPLANLTELKTLEISVFGEVDLTPLAQLSKLIELKIDNTANIDLRPLASLTALKSLHILGTQEIDLTQILALKNLEQLVARSVPTSDLSPFLTWIRSGIPVKVKSQWLWIDSFFKQGITVDGDSLVTPPTEIVKQGNEAILNYFEEKQTQGVDHLYEAKLLIVGEGGAGKTSLLRRLYQTNQPLPEEAETTKGIDIHRHEFKLSNGRDFRLNVWDFGGQEIYHATHQFFLTKRSLYVLLDDTRKDNKTVQDEGFKYWLEVIDQLSDHSPVLIFQNEKGGRSKTIDEAGIKGHFDNVKEVFRGNLEFDHAADRLRDALEYHAQNLPHIGEELPARWVSIRAEIETLAEQKPHILQQEYFDLYAKHLKFDREKALFLSRYLHDLGVFLHFQDDIHLAKTVILQNTWATEAVFKMLDDEIVKAALGHFNLQDCRRVWQDSQYADMHAELLALMQKFELCYPLPDTSTKTWLAPQLLPPSKPSVLAKWEQPGDLVLRYRYEFMPKGLISRLMVRLHRFVPQPELGWVTGVLFERDGSQVLVEIPPKGAEIALRARGPECKELLTVISADLDALNDSFRLNDEGHRDKVEKLVPCNCKQCQSLTLPRSFEQRELLRRKEHSKFKVECPGSFDYVDVLELLDGIHSERLPLWAEEQSTITTKPLKIFISYSKHDLAHKDSLLKHLTGLRDKIVPWNDRDLLPGEEWDARIKEELHMADIVLYLVTANSMATGYIQNVELPLIEARCKTGECKLVPVIVDFCHWSDLDFAKYNALPDKGEPVTNTKYWVNENQAWLKVVEGISRIIAS